MLGGASFQSLVTPTKDRYTDGETIWISATANPGYLLVNDAYLNYSFQISANTSVTIDLQNDHRDNDGDGLTNYQEIIQLLTNPNLTDSNADSIEDNIAVQNGLDPNYDYSSLLNYIASSPERFGYATLDDLVDLRVDSKIMSVNGNEAILQILVEESVDLSSWATRQALDLNISLQEGETTKFFRYKIAD